MTALAITAIVTGSLYALAAMGLVLTYRASGVFNFAHGAMGMFIAYCYWQVQAEWDVPVLLALFVALAVAAPLVGVLAERVFRPLTKEPVVVQIVASLGIIVFLQNLAIRLFGADTKLTESIFPAGTVRVSDIRVGYDQIGAVLVTIACATALTLVLRGTAFGLKMRAVVDNAPLAELAGTSSVAVSRASWVVGVAFAGLGGIMLAPFVGLNVNTLTLLVIAAYAAAMFGRLESLLLTFVGGLTLGFGENLITFYAPPGGILVGLRGSLTFLLLFALLIVHQRRLPRERKPERIDWRRFELPARASRAVAASLTAVLVLLPAVLHEDDVFNVTAAVVSAVILLSLVVLTGFSGQISLCQASFVGIGAYTAGHLGGDGGGLWWAMVVAAAIAAPVGAIVGLPSLRLSGLFLALATMAFALLMDNLIFPIKEIGGVGGMAVPSPTLAGIDVSSPRRFYYVCVAFLLGFSYLTVMLRRGRLGRRLQALRDSPEALRTLGVNLAVTRLAVFALSAAMAAAGGVLFGSYRSQVTSGDFNLFASIGYLVSAVVGGVSSVGGAMLGGLSVSLPQILQRTQGGSSSFSKFYPLAIGLIVVFLARYPNGVISFITERVRRWSTLLRVSEDDQPEEPLAMTLPRTRRQEGNTRILQRSRDRS